MTNKEGIEFLKNIKDSKAVTLIDNDFTDRYYIDALQMAIKALENERPQGKWIPNDTLFHHGKTSYRCSVCNDVIDDVPTCLNKPLYKYCPVCGAELEVDND